MKKNYDFVVAALLVVATCLPLKIEIACFYGAVAKPMAS